MKQFMQVVIASLILFGCSSTPQTQTTTYLLSSMSVGTAVYDETMPKLLVQPANVASYLSGDGIAYRTSANEVVIAQNNLWGEDIAEQISTLLVNRLKRAPLSVWPMRGNSTIDTMEAQKLLINVAQFEGNYKGNAIFAGEWSLVDAQGSLIVSENFYFEEPLREEGYKALVDALDQTVDMLADVIANALTPISA
ncbi:PqiC family protein [Enterovibrio nigricans]|uniref:ABC-type transport auxiliary lipoprotein component domain-containing protein n=1 Tax=Enterovibrio nigricans DSM 22720 TaxID=1121868 RepID=A0A1T4W6X1_9GAMM|nr:ABC-type transport auxiliary lipoprotein family protein [Enterovibrio nigricans]PKF48882.1 hypothetical protein AT251_22905 [Enterovibrio nigricans]SKA72461.1 hypothetical protein SAMN02745132_04760 [Enterovibrio nigricans DSM 22720]